ncbi:WhiB family transcriptional regulator [Streptomyces sp. NRRL B-1347]|uniref:WhiB family transcriptional regulator n=1 Tax=Streptomyces sp. NRRL B-1347 TaxID=1476877 RepID=UPI0006912613|nr:WhiB family transcriptional regulator [Streptomyces sp. NRRL B-1347]
MKYHYSARHRPDTVERPSDWSGAAPCGPEGKDDDDPWRPDRWFPEGDGPGARYKARQAKGICSGCPVRMTCLQGALERDERHGIWGGLDYAERVDLMIRIQARKRAADDDAVPAA